VLASGRLVQTPAFALFFARLTRASAALNVIGIEKRREAAPSCASGSDAQPVPGGEGDTDARQQKARREMQHSIYF
jgi:hypothetical protein